MRAKLNSIQWRVHTPNLLKEIMNNSGSAVLHKPLIIFAELLHRVGCRALELDDPKLHELMCRLTIYSAADPESPDYNKEVLRELGLYGRKKRKKR